MTERVVRDGHCLDGFLVEETAPAGHDIVIGGFRDPSFGQVVMVGLGGVFVELLQDVAFRICPITRLDAREMIEELKGAPILAGARGGAHVPVAVVVDALMAFAGEGGLLVELAERFAEVDVNPLIVSAAGVVAVDARFVLVPETDDAG
jgi:acetyl-CoA synthetase (ADP-forming)